MHSRIFQVSANPISREEWINGEDAYNERLMDYCIEQDSVEKDIEWLLEICGNVFSWDGECLTIIDTYPLVNQWHLSVKKAYRSFNVTDPSSRYWLTQAIENPLGSFLFYIDGWTDCTTNSDRFVEWIRSKFKPGDKIYIGAVLDYHF